MNRVTDVSYPGGVTEAFSYDAAGNRVEHTNTDGDTIGFTVDDTGQLISDTTGTTYSYDQAGNLLATSAGDSYVYDDYGRTVQATGNGVAQTFGYDATDVRVTVDGIDQLWDRNGGLPTLISAGVGDNYVHTNTGIARDGDDWLLADAVGSVRAIVDDTGATTGSQDFTVFGEQLAGTGDFGFAGEQADLTGQLHLRARQYNPSLGRFTSVDPVQPGAPGTTGYNLYAYSGNNPTTWTDPTGQLVAEYDATLTPSRTTAAGSGAAAAEIAYLNSIYYGVTATTSGSAIAAASGATTTTIGSSLFGKFVIGALGLGAGGLLLGGDTPQPEPETELVNPPIVETPQPDQGTPAAEPEPQLATDGSGARDGGPCEGDYEPAPRGGGDRAFDSLRQAIREALRTHNVPTSQPNSYTIVEMYGSNPNLVGPKGEPWHQIRATNSNGNPVTIDIHSNGHIFSDVSPAQVSGPHVHGASGEHFDYPGSC